MLQPDELIMQKEWHQLTDAEKETLRELADSEATFNLIKKMLIVSAEDAANTPELSTDVYMQVIKELPAAKTNIKKYWYAVAAITLVILSAGIFLLKKETTSEYVKSTIELPVKDSLIQKEEQLVHQTQDSAFQDISIKNVTDKKQKKNVVKQNLRPVKSPQFNISDTSVQHIYAVQINVAADPTLLNFIHEAD